MNADVWILCALLTAISVINMVTLVSTGAYHSLNGTYLQLVSSFFTSLKYYKRGLFGIVLGLYGVVREESNER